MAARLDSVETGNSTEHGEPIDLTEPFMLGEWRIDPVAGKAHGAATTVKIDPRNMRVLQILVARRGEPVSLRDLQSLAWDGAIVTTDSSYQSIRQLRQALGDTRSPSRYIQTLPRRGYRLIASVSAIAAVQSPAETKSPTIPAMAEALPPALSETPAQQSARRPWRHAYATIATAFAVVAWGWVFYVQFHSASPIAVTVPDRTPTFERSDVSTNPDHHVLTVRDLRDLGSMAITGGRPREAQEYFQRALDKQLAETGERSEVVANILVELSRANLWLDDQPAAYEAATRAMKLFDQLAPKSNPDLILAYSVAAEAFIATGDYDGAEPLVESSLSLAQRLYGDDNIKTVEPRGLRAILLFAAGRLPDAEREARRTVETITRASGPGDFRTAHWHAVVGAILMDQGRLAEAEAEARVAKEILDRSVAETHPYALSAMHVLAETLAKQRRNLDEAEALAGRVLDMLKTSGAADWRLARTAGLLGEVLLLKGRVADANRHFLVAKQHLPPAIGWPVDRESRNLDARIRLLSQLHGDRTSVASL